MKNTLIIGLFSLAFLMAGCGDGEKKATADNSPAINVSVSSVSGESGDSFLTASGKVEAVNSANLSTRMMGIR